MNKTFHIEAGMFTWAEMAEVNEPETMAALAELQIGESTVLGMSDHVTRLADVSPIPTRAPAARFAIRHGSGFCVVDTDVLREAVRQDEGGAA